MLYGAYDPQSVGSGSATARFVQDYGVDSVLAEAIVTAIGRGHSDLDAGHIAHLEKFCARSFKSKDAWLAAVVAFDSESVSDRIAAFNKLRDTAGPALWEKILLKAHLGARSATMLQEDYDGVADDVGYETAFSNQCKILEKRP